MSKNEQQPVFEGGDNKPATKPTAKKKSNGTELNPFKAKDIAEFALAFGKELAVEDINEAMKTLSVKTVHGEITMDKYDKIVTAKIFEYVRYGTARKVWKMMIRQDSSTTTDDLLTILLECARMEIEFGLRPLVHVIPVAGQPYVKADGYLDYAHRSGKLKEIKWEDTEKNGAWESKCIVILNDDAQYEGIAIVQPTNNRMDDPREKARTKAMRRALRRAFPIGASDEIYDEFEKISFEEANKHPGIKEPQQPPEQSSEPVNAASDLRDLQEE